MFPSTPLSLSLQPWWWWTSYRTAHTPINYLLPSFFMSSSLHHSGQKRIMHHTAFSVEYMVVRDFACLSFFTNDDTVWYIYIHICIVSCIKVLFDILFNDKNIKKVWTDGVQINKTNKRTSNTRTHTLRHQQLNTWYDQSFLRTSAMPNPTKPNQIKMAFGPSRRRLPSTSQRSIHGRLK